MQRTKSVWPRRLLLFLMMLAGTGRAAMNQPAETFAIDFDQDASAKPPAWIAGIERQDGDIAGDPKCWIVAKDAPEMTGRLLIHLDRKNLPADLSLTLVYEDLDDSRFLIQLLDAQGEVIVPDMFSSIVDTGRETLSDTYIINFIHHFNARTIAIQRVRGPLKIYGVALTSVVCDLPSVVDTDRENCLAENMDSTAGEKSELNRVAEQIAGKELDWSERHLLLSQDASPEIMAEALLAAKPLPEYLPEEDVAGQATIATSGTCYIPFAAAVTSLKRWQPMMLVEQEDTSTPMAEALFMNRAIKVMATSEPMSLKDREEYFARWKTAPVDVPFAIGALYVVVHKDNPITHITLPQLESIYAQEPAHGRKTIRTWPELNQASGYKRPLNVYGGWPEFGTSRSFSRLAMQGKPFHSRMISGSVLSCEKVATDEGAIGFVSVPPRYQDARVIPVAVSEGREAYLPNVANMYSRAYPLTRKFYLTIAGNSVADLPPPERELVDFILSYQGQAELARNGLLPLTLDELAHTRSMLKLD